MFKCMHVSQNGSVFIKDIDIKPILYIYNVVRPKKDNSYSVYQLRFQKSKNIRI